MSSIKELEPNDNAELSPLHSLTKSSEQLVSCSSLGGLALATRFDGRMMGDHNRLRCIERGLLKPSPFLIVLPLSADMRLASPDLRLHSPDLRLQPPDFRLHSPAALPPAVLPPASVLWFVEMFVGRSMAVRNNESSVWLNVHDVADVLLSMLGKETVGILVEIIDVKLAMLVLLAVVLSEVRFAAPT